ncbi:hypothetical protein BAE44_0013013 [Dichanthelium oligosanthes]|uniref:F-box domain-containing protein n=1 Tax=Dichanthelium oligosanthes TaxID=888268 RepID=A0A1E5VLF9_9POAL|nr:hypothetical protein BAE44_0013013 [Dichanthelium oligosanthes]
MASAALLRKDKLDDDNVPLAVAANNGEVLPRDMLCEVLFRLQADELCRLRLVCRLWRSLTSEPSFASTHASRHPPHFAAFHGTSRQVHVLDLAGNIVKRIRLDQLGIVPPPSTNIFMESGFDLEIVSDGWWQACEITVVPTGEITANIAHENHLMHQAGETKFLFGHAPSTGENKVLAIRSNLECGVYNDGSQWARPIQTCDIMALGGSDLRRRVRPGPPAYVALDPWHMTLSSLLESPTS